MSHRRAVAASIAAAVLLATMVGPASARPEVDTSRSTPSTSGAPRQDGGEDGSLKSQYDEVLGQEAEMIARVDRAQSKRLQLTAELNDLQEQLRAKQLELLGAQSDLDQADLLAKIYAQALVDAKAKLKVAEERLRSQIVASYVNGGQDADLMEAILNSRNGQEAGQAMAFSRAVVGDTEVLVRRLERAREEVRRTDRQARDARRKAADRRDEVKDAATFIEGSRNHQQQLVFDVNVQVVEEAQALREVQGRKALVEGRINAMTRSSDGIAMILADFEKGQPDWIPGSVLITNPLPGRRISSPFGMRHHPILGIDRLHAGGDMGAPSGTPIHAAADGIVVIAGVHGGYGNTTAIDHGNSLGTLYGHQSSIAVRVGQMVKRGDVIGYVGSTGLSTGPHLHFETRIKGMPIDPVGVVDFDAKVDYGP